MATEFCSSDEEGLEVGGSARSPLDILYFLEPKYCNGSAYDFAHLHGIAGKDVADIQPYAYWQGANRPDPTGQTCTTLLVLSFSTWNDTRRYLSEYHASPCIFGTAEDFVHIKHQHVAA